MGFFAPGGLELGGEIEDLQDLRCGQRLNGEKMLHRKGD